MTAHSPIRGVPGEEQQAAVFFTWSESVQKVPFSSFLSPPSLLTHTDFRRSPVTTIVMNDMQINI